VNNRGKTFFRFYESGKKRQALILLALEIIKTTLPFSLGGKFSGGIQVQKSVENGVETFREKNRKNRSRSMASPQAERMAFLIWNRSKTRSIHLWRNTG